MQTEEKSCQRCGNRFSVEADDVAFYQKMDVPAPTWCPMCRAQRRLMWRAERALYRRKSDLTGKDIFSTYHQQAPVKVYENEEWWSDKWDAMDYGKDIDWTRPFLEQVKELANQVPKPARSVYNTENSDYSNNAGQLKDCYLVFTGQGVESSFYTVGITESRDCMDGNYIYHSELCYWCFNCTKCFQCFYSIDCENSQNLWFCKNVVNSSDCFGCVNIRDKRFCIYNQQYTEAEYKEHIKALNPQSYAAVQGIWKQVLEFQARFPVKFAHENQNENCTGEGISNSTNVQQSYYVASGENVKYCQMVLAPTVKDSYDYCFWGGGSELIYESVNVGYDPSRLKFCLEMYPSCSDSEYSMYCTVTSNVFGCVGLNKKQFCILNKQYTEEEYKELVKKLKQHMIDFPYTDKAGRTFAYGEFFPPEFLPYGYNETLAYELFPMTEEEAVAEGIPWRTPEVKSYPSVTQAASLPDTIAEAPADILQTVIACEHAGTCAHNCTTAFKLIPQELAFYQKQGIPLPHLCPSCRHYQRIPFRNFPQLRTASCQCAGVQDERTQYQNVAQHDHAAAHCPREFMTAYKPDYASPVYCKECFNAETV